NQLNRMKSACSIVTELVTEIKDEQEDEEGQIYVGNDPDASVEIDEVISLDEEILI
ncbi:MAG: hypothetical protein EZS28_033479, partial [Streblomastix strix]